MELSHFQSHGDSVVVSIRKAGFLDTTVVVMVGVADTVPLQVNLRRADVALPAAIAMALGSGIAQRGAEQFEARRSANSGIFLTSDDLQKEKGRTIRDVVHDHTPCGTVSINGQHNVLWYGDPEASGVAYREYQILLKSNAEEFAAVEIYNGNVPVELTSISSAHPRCMVVLWQRSSFGGN